MKPMLAKEPADLSALSFPVLAQPKLDGIRAIVKDGKLLSRNLKPIPNAEIRAALENNPALEGLDGELLIGDGTNFQASTSFVMSEDKRGEPWAYYVFDIWDSPYDNYDRLAAMRNRVEDANHDRIRLVTTKVIHGPAELEEFEASCLAVGFEGVIVRKPDALYKFGRSTPKAGPLWKIKRFIDFEAEVIGVFEEKRNDNPAMTNALGRTERSSHGANKTGKGTLGGLILRALNGPAEGCEFRCGTGFNAEQRKLWWVQHQAAHPTSAVLTGKVAKIKSFPIGVKEAPRFPVFLAFRDMEIDG